MKREAGENARSVRSRHCPRNGKRIKANTEVTASKGVGRQSPAARHSRVRRPAWHRVADSFAAGELGYVLMHRLHGSHDTGHALIGVLHTPTEVLRGIGARQPSVRRLISNRAEAQVYDGNRCTGERA